MVAEPTVAADVAQVFGDRVSGKVSSLQAFKLPSRVEPLGSVLRPG